MVIVVLYFPIGNTADVRKSQGGISFGIGKIACEDLTKGLIGYYKFDDVPGATINSVEGVDNAVFVNGAAVASGIRGKAASFDDTDDYITISGLNANTAAGGKNTVSFWMNKSNASNDMVFGWNTTAYQLYFSSGCFGFNTGEGNVFGFPFSSSDYVNKWVHVVAIFYNGVPDSTNNEIWINGVKQDIYACFGSTTASPSATTAAFIGKWKNPSLYFGGRIDDVHIYNRALSASEIEQLYDNPGCP